MARPSSAMLFSWLIVALAAFISPKMALPVGNLHTQDGSVQTSDLSHAHKPRICAWVHSHDIRLRRTFREAAKGYVQHLYFMLDEFDVREDTETDIVTVPGRVTHLHLYIKARAGLEKLRAVMDQCDWFLKLDEDAVINWDLLVDMFKMLQPVSYPIYGGYMYYFTLTARKAADTYFSAKPLPFAPYANGPLYYMNKALFRLMEPFDATDIFWTGHAEDACIGVFLRDNITEPILFHDLRGSIFGKYMIPVAPPEHSCWWVALHEIPSDSEYREPCTMPRNLLPSIGVWVVSRQHQLARRLTTAEMNNIFGHLIHVPSTIPPPVKSLRDDLEETVGIKFSEILENEPKVNRRSTGGPFFEPPFNALPFNLDGKTFPVDLFSSSSSVSSASVLDIQDRPSQLVISLSDDNYYREIDDDRVPGEGPSPSQPYDPSELGADSRRGLSPYNTAGDSSMGTGGPEDQPEEARFQRLTNPVFKSTNNIKKPWQIRSKLKKLPPTYAGSLPGPKPWQPMFAIHSYKSTGWATLLFLLSKTRGALVTVGDVDFDDLIGMSVFGLASQVIHIPCDASKYVKAASRAEAHGHNGLFVDPRCVTVRPVLREAELVVENPPRVSRVVLRGNTLDTILRDYGITDSSQVVVMASLDDRRTVASIQQWAKMLPVKPWLVFFGWAPPGSRIVLQKLTSMYGSGHSAHEGNAYFFGPTVHTSTCCGPEHPMEGDTGTNDK